MRPLLAVMLRVHRRHQYLPLIRTQLNALRRVVDLRVVVQTDRPTPQVKTELDRLACFENYIEFKTPSELVGASGEQFMEALQNHYAWATAGIDDAFALTRFSGNPIRPAAFACLWEDDEILCTTALYELLELLGNWPHYLDGVRLESLFVQGDPGHYNAAFPRHWRHFVFRVEPGLEYNPRGLMVHAPERLVQLGTWWDLKAPAWNYGYLDDDDREATWQAYRRAGKIDAHTLCLKRPPTLKPLHQGEHGTIARESDRHPGGRHDGRGPSGAEGSDRGSDSAHRRHGQGEREVAGEAAQADQAPIRPAGPQELPLA